MVPSVSLIVLNWDGREHLAQVLRCLTSLDYPNERLELLVVDNGSRDGSAEMVRRDFSRVRLIQLDVNQGFAEPNNLGVAVAAGDWVGFLNNDMRMDPAWLTNLMSTLKDRPRAACLGSRILSWGGQRLEFIGGGVTFTGHGFQSGLGDTESAEDREKRVLFACGGAMVVRRSVFDEVGGFDPDYFAYYEDVDLGWRLNLLGHEVWYTPRASVEHRHHSTGRRLPEHKLRVLYERNALFTIYKCLAEDNLAAALPAALLLLNERGLNMADVDAARFRLAPASPGGPSEPKLGAIAQRLHAYDPAAPLGRSLAARAGEVLSEEGVGSALRKTRRHLRQQVQAGARRLLPSPGGAYVPDVATSNHVAAGEFARALSGLNPKRGWVQLNRRCSDSELIPLMVDPLRSSYGHPRYLAFQRWLVEVQGLDRRFSRAPD